MSSRRSPSSTLALQLAQEFARVYYFCHPAFSVDLTHQAVRALQFVHENPGGTVQAVAQHLGCAQNTGSEILRRLTDRGFIDKQRNGPDARAVRLTLTEEGRKILKEQTQLDEAKLARGLATLTARERDQLLASVSLLRQKLESL
jgi:DNA-binding MarR family transcriptional regulator